MSQASLSTVLKDAGYSITKPRQLVFDMLQEHRLLSIQEMTKLSRSMDRASLYRTLNLFMQLGIVQRISLGWKYKYELAERFSPHHHHLICQKCHEVISIDDDKGLEEFIARVSAKHQFSPHKHQFEVEGHCATCR